MLTLTNVDPYALVRNNSRAKYFTSCALDALAEFLDDLREVDEASIDEFLFNSTEYDTLQEALDDHDAKNIDEMLDSDGVAYVSELENGHVLVIY